VSGRLITTIADRHLRPTRHADGCSDECKPGCPIREYDAELAAPIRESEIAAEKANEERLRAFAEQFNGAMRGE
jgi:hypothetical protein